jgi:hypothetical protein
MGYGLWAVSPVSPVILSEAKDLSGIRELLRKVPRFAPDEEYRWPRNSP